MFVSQGSGGSMMVSLRTPEVTKQRLRPGTVRRILPYAKPYRWALIALLLVTVVDSLIIVAVPLLLKEIIDRGILHHDTRVITVVAIIVAALAVLDGGVQYTQTYFSARIGQGLSYDLRMQVFDHVQRQPIAFFTRAQTGSLVSRLNTDVVGAQQAITQVLTVVVSSVLTLVLVLAEMFYLSWQISLAALALIPFFVIPGRVVGRKLQQYSREQMQLNAEMGAAMHERFNVAGAILAKLYGRPRDETRLFGQGAGRVRDVGVTWAVYGRLFMIIMTLLASLITALVYGLGGALTVSGAFGIGTLVALAALLGRLYAPITQLSNVQSNAVTAAVCFDRLFEVLELKPLVAEQPGAAALRPPEDGAAPEIAFDRVSFRYPAANEVSLASLESVALPVAERATTTDLVLSDVTFRAPSGKLTALVGPSGAGKTTITHLVSRLYDPTSGTVRVAADDVRDVTLESVHDTIGVVTQDAHMFHDTIRANLAYARPGATEDELIDACRAAQIWDLIASLPAGLDTVVGDRGYRLSGGEKQRVAIARLLLKAPSVVVLDEATAHLDSESEAAVQAALKTALTGRTSLVIAHRLSTIREADQILVIDDGQVKQSGTHEELLASGGLYADLYRIQFARQETGAGNGHEPGSTQDGAVERVTVLQPGDPGYPADGPGGRLVVKQAGDAAGSPADGAAQRVMVKEAGQPGQAPAADDPDQGGIKIFRRK
jgi:ATP-binding cassette subfamily B protein